MFCPKYSDRHVCANNVDPDQSAAMEQFDQGALIASQSAVLEMSLISQIE